MSASALTAPVKLERGHAAGTTSVAAPCVEAWAHQQVAARFSADTSSARNVGTLQSWVGVGTLADGVCLRSVTELHQRGWAISSIALTARGRGEDGLPVTFTRIGTDESEDLDLLWVPLPGCVRVHGTITATRRGRDARRRTDVATRTATGTYGRDCPRAPDHGAYQGDDGMLVR